MFVFVGVHAGFWEIVNVRVTRCVPSGHILPNRELLALLEGAGLGW